MNEFTSIIILRRAASKRKTKKLPTFSIWLLFLLLWLGVLPKDWLAVVKETVHLFGSSKEQAGVVNFMCYDLFFLAQKEPSKKAVCLFLFL